MPKSLAELTEPDYEEITSLAALFFTPRDISIMLELPAEQFIRECENTDSPVYLAFYKGRLQAEVDLRTSIMKMAKAGSGPAQTMAMDLLNKSKVNMLNR